LKFKDRIKQFGFFTTIKTSFYYLIRHVVRIESYIILIIEDHEKSSIDDLVSIMTSEKIENWKKNKFISKKDFVRFMKFLNSGCIGYYIEIENELAAWGFVETKGVYQYGKYLYKIPYRMHILKNLFVRPKFRGMSLGKHINKARINSIPDGYIPCGFVVPENRFAIRNLKMFGFEEYLTISNITLFKTFEKAKIKTLKNDEMTKLIISGFKK